MSYNNKPHGLQQLLDNNKEAKEFFLKLPEDVQGMLYQNTFKINSLKDLYYNVQNMYK